MIYSNDKICNSKMSNPAKYFVFHPRSIFLLESFTVNVYNNIQAEILSDKSYSGVPLIHVIH